MSLRSAARPLLLALPLLCAPLAGGCSSTGPEKAQANEAGLAQLEARLAETHGRIGSSSEALARVLAEAEGDLRPPYESFTKELDSLASSVKSLRKEATASRERSASFFADWERNQASLQDPELGRIAENRRVALQKRQREAEERTQALEQRIETHLSTLRDIGSFLSHDLNKSGVVALKDRIRGSTKEARSIQEAIEKVRARLAEVRTSISARPAGAAAGGG